MANMSEQEYEVLRRQQQAKIAGRRATVEKIETMPKMRKVIRQSSKQPNKTEERFRLTFLEAWVRDGTIDRYGAHESITLKLANGMTLRPDWPVWKGGVLSFFEVKGAFVYEDAIIKLKAFPIAYPEHKLTIYQWKKGEWIIQEVLGI